MQTVLAALQTILDVGINANADAPVRDFEEVIEFYATDYDPPVGGFDPTDAEERFASSDLTWNGLAYRREAEVGRGEATRFMSKTFNSCSVKFSNVDRYMATWITSTDIEGMRMVVRIISRSVTTSSIVLFVGRVDKPVEFDRITATVSAKQDLGNLEFEIPPHSFLPDDPEGRTPDNVLYEGFRFQALSGSFFRTETSMRTSLFGLRAREVTLAVPDQWSSADDTPYGNPVPECFGRVQVELIPIMYADTGSGVRVLGVACKGPVLGIENARNASTNLGEFAGQTIHLGDTGGTGTNAADPPQFPGAGVFSHTAYVDGYVRGGDVNTLEGPPTLVAVVIGRLIPLPDGSGNFTLTGWTHSGPYITRYLLNDPDWGNIAEAFISDTSIVNSATICAEPVEDVSQREQLLVPNTDLPAVGTIFRRYRSTGILDPHRIGFDEGLPGFDTPPGAVEADPTGYDETNPPDTFASVTYLRERYTTNFAIREKIKLVDLLYDIVLRSFRGYLVINAKGQIEVRVERPADNGLLRGNTLVGATNLPIDDVTPWKTGELLLRGKVLIGNGLVTGEVRTVTSATYSTAGNSITLNASGTGGITATRSGATLSGGSTTVPASGTVTIGGTPSVGATATATIEGVAITHTLTADDTKETVAKLLSLRINANATLKRFITASYSSASPFVVTITAKLGIIHFAALVNTHAIAEEVVRVMMTFSDASKNADGSVSAALIQAGLTRNNIIKDSFKWPLGGKQSSINRIEINYREAKDDFAATRLFVNDVVHQEQIRKKNVLKVDGSAIDNFNQASRIANAALSKNREGDWFATWSTNDPNAMLLEEGDLVAVSDDSGGLVNQVLRVEEVRISSERVISITGRRYSTNMFSDTVSAHVIPLPTTLRYSQTAHTQFVPMDLPFWRETDPDTAGIHVATNRSLALGDWTGTVIYHDATGAYVSVSSEIGLRVPIGVSTNALTATTNTQTLDTVSTVRVQITTPEGAEGAVYALTSTTEAKLKAGANKYALGINGRWEIAHFQTATLVGGTDDTYDLTVHLRGRHGTGDHTSDHAISDKFVLLTDADGNDTGVTFVPLDIRLMNHTFNLKAKTTNQDLADATAESFPWTGKVLQLLPTINHRGTRDSGNDLLIECEGQTRIGGGLRSLQGGAVNEEEQEYRAQILNAGSVTLPNGRERVLSFSPGMALAAFLTGTVPAYISHNSYYSTAGISSAGRIVQEIPGPNNHLDGLLTYDFIGGGITGLGLQKTGGTWKGFGADITFAAGTGGGASTLAALAGYPYTVIITGELDGGGVYARFHVYEYGTRIFSKSSSAAQPDYEEDFWGEPTPAGGWMMRLRFNFVGSSVRIEKAPAPNLPFKGVVTGNRASVFPMFGVIGTVGGFIGVSELFLTTRPFPKTIYSAAQQTEDGFTPGNPIQMDVWQHSKISGAGVKTRVTL